MNEIDDLRNSLREVINFARDNLSSLSVGAKTQLAQFVESAANRLEQLEQTQQQAQQQPSQIPDTARLLWVAAGGDVNSFVRFLGNYPSPELADLQRNPQLLIQIIERLQQEIPQGQPTTSPEGIKESWLPSSNVWGFSYDPNSKKMLVKFNGKDEKSAGPTYSYDNVPPQLAQLVEAGAIPAKTTGSNKWGSWWTGKNPSIAASVNALLVKGGFPYARIN